MPVNPPALFIADADGLDFLNSVATPVDTPVDWIDDGAGLVEWLRQADLAPPDQLEAITARAAPGELDEVAGQARALRDWFKGFVRAHAGRPLGAEALDELAPLNRLLERDEIHGRVQVDDDDGHGRLVFARVRRWRSPESLLLPIGEAMARLVADEDFTHVKACEGHNCTLMFVDHTRARARRWCSMGLCGNRAKVSAHRKRKREG